MPALDGWFGCCPKECRNVDALRYRGSEERQGSTCRTGPGGERKLISACNPALGRMLSPAVGPCTPVLLGEITQQSRRRCTSLLDRRAPRAVVNGGTDSDFGVRLSGADGDLAMAGLAADRYTAPRRRCTGESRKARKACNATISPSLRAEGDREPWGKRSPGFPKGARNHIYKKPVVGRCMRWTRERWLRCMLRCRAPRVIRPYNLATGPSADVVAAETPSQGHSLGPEGARFLSSAPRRRWRCRDGRPGRNS
jgi:hypothetical protein